MKRPTPRHRESRLAGPGEQRLRSLLARLRAARISASPMGARPMGGQESRPPIGPRPESEWEHATEFRLGRIEQQLNNQNRLLLFTLISIVADVLIGFTRQ